MTAFSPQLLNQFIVQAKAATYIGNGEKTASHRPKSHDLEYRDGDFYYLDSYFGDFDFIGEEVVYFQNTPIWAMNYFGRVIRADKINAAQAGQVIRESLSTLYAKGRFLGGFQHKTTLGTYHDTNTGDVDYFTGFEWIEVDDIRVYELVYHGGKIK